MIILLPYTNRFIVFPLEDQAEKPPDLDGILPLSVPREEAGPCHLASRPHPVLKEAPSGALS
jgi:hypothetical protein